jgi:hypothetical protein
VTSDRTKPGVEHVATYLALSDVEIATNIFVGLPVVDLSTLETFSSKLDGSEYHDA